MRLNKWRVLELAERAGFKNQAALADHVGVSRQTLSGWLNGGLMRIDHLGVLCEAIGCTPNDILQVREPEPAGVN